MAAWPLAVLAFLYGVHLARHEGARPARAVWFPGDGRAPTVDGQPVDAVQVTWRGPLAFMRWRDRAGRWQRLAWWPDTLPAPMRRELRLAASSTDAVRRRAGVAP
ncbi:hypothetical protein OVA13_02600 [Pseudoxanthomonas sp. SL93]|uniref:hypothetical protein n=1 Tax=Pseudoxanthomonas sp. SL93 TaxID=2995142 RepID=UPI002271F30D|nr:hypothetical protein [Pseudoxanthomonas sp. SL93]WAC63699.1 hypothetical protein OVA13_02600 [Pseudoxanthomonas sp. SL93]